MKVEKTWFYSFARTVIGFVYSVIFRVKATGTENFPAETNCIIISNHISAWDPLTIGYLYRHSEVHFVAKDSLFKIPVLRAVLRALHAIPVSRGETDIAAMRAAMRVLRDGHVLGIFPEGHRQRGGRIGRIETGVAVMALGSGAPLVPVLISGKYRPFGGLRAAVGRPIELADLRARRADAETLEEVKARVRTALEALRPQADFRPRAPRTRPSAGE